MQVYNQGEEYQEDELDEENVEDEGEEEVESKITTIYGIPIKKAVVIIAIVIVIIAVLLLFATRKSSSSDDTVDLSEYEQYVPEEDTYYEDTTTYTDTTTTDTSTSSSSDDMVFDPDLGYWVPAGEETETVEPTDATDEEVLKLRAMGYTGDEIEYSLANGFSVDDLVDAAQELYDEEAKEALIRMSDSASDEFLYIVDNTYFSQPYREFISYQDAQMGTYDYGKYSFTVNADYVKCPSYGTQLYLKCRVMQDLYVWYQVTPMRYAQLPEKGNIVLKVDYIQYGENMYVTDLMETDSTLDTIDSSDISTDTVGTTAVVDETEVVDDEVESVGESDTE